MFHMETIELLQPDGPNFKVNGHRVKHYFGGDMPSKVKPTSLHSSYMAIKILVQSSSSAKRNVIKANDWLVLTTRNDTQSSKKHSNLDAAVLTCLAVLIDVAALGELCLAALTGTSPDFVATAVGTKFLLGCG
ncbi:hypothetical protein Tco_0078801 [Tanacetum coccineum]